MFNSLYKTKLCNNFLQDGICPYAERCQYAHGIEELREPDFKRDMFCIHCVEIHLECIHEMQKREEEYKRKLGQPNYSNKTFRTPINFKKVKVPCSCECHIGPFDHKRRISYPINLDPSFGISNKTAFSIASIRDLDHCSKNQVIHHKEETNESQHFQAKSNNPKIIHADEELNKEIVSPSQFESSLIDKNQLRLTNEDSNKPKNLKKLLEDSHDDSQPENLPKQSLRNSNLKELRNSKFESKDAAADHSEIHLLDRLDLTLDKSNGNLQPETLSVPASSSAKPKAPTEERRSFSVEEDSFRHQLNCTRSYVDNYSHTKRTFSTSLSLPSPSSVHPNISIHKKAFFTYRRDSNALWNDLLSEPEGISEEKRTSILSLFRSIKGSARSTSDKAFVETLEANLESLNIKIEKDAPEFLADLTEVREDFDESREACSIFSSGSEEIQKNHSQKAKKELDKILSQHSEQKDKMDSLLERRRERLSSFQAIQNFPGPSKFNALEEALKDEEENSVLRSTSDCSSNSEPLSLFDEKEEQIGRRFSLAERVESYLEKKSLDLRLEGARSERKSKTFRDIDRINYCSGADSKERWGDGLLDGGGERGVGRRSFSWEDGKTERRRSSGERKEGGRERKGWSCNRKKR